jgi:hypothetical protein
MVWAKAKKRGTVLLGTSPVKKIRISFDKKRPFLGINTF